MKHVKKKEEKPQYTAPSLIFLSSTPCSFKHLRLTVMLATGQLVFGFFTIPKKYAHSYPIESEFPMNIFVGIPMFDGQYRIESPYFILILWNPRFSMTFGAPSKHVSGRGPSPHPRCEVSGGLHSKYLKRS